MESGPSHSAHHVTTKFLRDVFERQNSSLLAKCSWVLSHVLHFLLQVTTPRDYVLFKDLLSVIPQGGLGEVWQFVDTVFQKKWLTYTTVDMHHIGTQGPGIVVANHPIWLIDGIVLFDLLRKQWQKIAVIGSSKASIFDPAWEHLIPITHTKDMADLYARVEAKLRDNYCVLMFPAGDVTYFRPEEQIFSGKKRRWTPVLRSSMFGVPIYPIHINVDIPQQHRTMFVESRSKLTAFKVNLRAVLEQDFLNNFTLTWRAPVHFFWCSYTLPWKPDDCQYATKQSAWLERYTSHGDDLPST